MGDVPISPAAARNYRYQHSYGVMLLASACRGERPYAAIWCERHEDILAERVDGRFDAWQVKTCRPIIGRLDKQKPRLRQRNSKVRTTLPSDGREDRSLLFRFEYRILLGHAEATICGNLPAAPSRC